TRRKQYFDVPARFFFDRRSQEVLSAGHRSDEQQYAERHRQQQVESADGVLFLSLRYGDGPDAGNPDNVCDLGAIESLQPYARVDDCVANVLLDFGIRAIVETRGN